VSAHARPQAMPPALSACLAAARARPGGFVPASSRPVLPRVAALMTRSADAPDRPGGDAPCLAAPGRLPDALGCQAGPAAGSATAAATAAGDGAHGALPASGGEPGGSACAARQGAAAGLLADDAPGNLVMRTSQSGGEQAAAGSGCGGDTSQGRPPGSPDAAPQESPC